MIVRSTTSTPASRSSVITRCRVMPLRNVPFGIGVCTTPPLHEHDVLRGELGDVADRVAHHGVVEAAPLRLGGGHRRERIQARRFRVRGRLIGRRPAVRSTGTP